MHYWHALVSPFKSRGGLSLNLLWLMPWLVTINVCFGISVTHCSWLFETAVTLQIVSPVKKTQNFTYVYSKHKFTLINSQIMTNTKVFLNSGI